MADFRIGRLKFKWRGDWSVSTSYLIDDIVKYGANTYVCVENHSSQSSIEGFYTDILKWNLQKNGNLISEHAGIHGLPPTIYRDSS